MNKTGLGWTAISAVLALCLGGCATTSKPEIAPKQLSLPSVLGAGPQARLLSSFRESQIGGTVPGGSLWDSYYTPAFVVTWQTPACLMQELRISADGAHQGSKHLAVLLWARFVLKNDGANSTAISEAEATQRCNDQPINYGWFDVNDREIQESLFAAWSASGALYAIASGRNNYAGIDLTAFASQPPPPKEEWGRSIREFAEDSSDDISSVTISRLDQGNIEAVVTFGMHPSGGCYLNVKVVSRDEISADRTRSERRISSIDVSKVSCYVV